MKTNMANTILLVEDDKILSTIISRKLEAKGHVVIKAFKGDVVKRQVIRHAPCAIIFDVDLPNMNGDKAFEAIRDFYTGIVVFHTAHQRDELELNCLKLGADDFISKSKSFDVFYQRLSRLLDKPEANESSPLSVNLGAFKFNKKQFTCSFHQQSIPLSSDESDLLSIFLINRDKLMTRDIIYNTLKGYPYDGQSRSVDISISRLKNKLNTVGISKDIISSIRGKGYIFQSMLLENTLQ